MKTTQENSEHYFWGNNCDGWHFLKSDSLSIIREKMPPGTEETMHFHSKSQQFFYILSGAATFVLNDKTETVAANEGLHILPGTHHQIKNNGTEDLHFLVISEPKAHGDRTNIEL